MQTPRPSPTFPRYTDSGARLLLCAIILDRRGHTHAGSMAIHLRNQIAAGRSVAVQQELARPK